MYHKFEAGKDQLLNDLIYHLSYTMTGKEHDLCAEFVRQCFGTVALDDLRRWSLENLSAAAFHFWSIIRERKSHEMKISIYNPSLQNEGFESPYTLVEVLVDDAPFLVDSTRMTVNRMGLSSHMVIHMGGIRLARSPDGVITHIYPRIGEHIPGQLIEAPIFLEIDKKLDTQFLSQLKETLAHVLKDNQIIVQDWNAMRAGIRSSIDSLVDAPQNLEVAEIEETKLFLTWIEDHHFTFLGMRDYDLVQENNEIFLKAVPGTGLGILREEHTSENSQSLAEMTPEARELSLSSRILVMSKTNTLATVHRDTYTDYIGIKRFDKKGRVIGERRVLGLYTSAAYNTNPKNIPFLRHKVALTMRNSLLNPRSHAGKVLLNILDTFPRDDLIQMTEDELLELSMGIFHMQERRCIRLFARMDVYHRFVSCFVYVPKDKFNSELRQVIQDILSENFHSNEISFNTYFSESILARIHFIVRFKYPEPINFDFKAIEKLLIKAGRSWDDELQTSLGVQFKDEAANDLFSQYKNAFPSVYRTNFDPETAVSDIVHIESLSIKNPLEINFYQVPSEDSQGFRLKLYQRDSMLVLSDVLPILENMGMRAMSEDSYLITRADEHVVWIIEFLLENRHAESIHIEKMRDIFQQAFLRIWFHHVENDGFNKLVLAAGLNWFQVVILRTYAKYFKQIGFTFSQEYIELALVKHASIAQKLAQLFELRFDTESITHREKAVHTKEKDIIHDLDQVMSLDEDKIIRQYVDTIMATVRTNAYQRQADGLGKPYVSIKLQCKDVPGLPRPLPLFEIFVYAPKFEGVHLRCAKVARGGLRWSDRKEDFRTEILGLMKAQHVKNAVIVPGGAKGGFVAKQISAIATREEVLEEGIQCYQYFIRGLLDITDNYQEAVVVKPEAVICYDEDDPYLVVAADKGTATFSDIANAISQEYQFWLGDAFASGGSVGYDHKKMGITAKGAWESVKRHFYQLDINIDTTDFTVVGIGDMAGDVFGNGMLLSKHIRLIAAFNHQHIFIDPNPNAATSFIERERLFHLPRSGWSDYSPELISVGGGVFNRSAKSIVLSTEIKRLFGIKQAHIEPNELIRHIMKSKVDLIWSAGIGTFVKADHESHADVGDRTNDFIRVNSSELRARIVGEGGNLGFTQLARVSYALNGGLIFTDFIDNSAGVSCSDKEVNIKILLNQRVAAGALKMSERNQLLSEMTEEVAALVVRENYLQTCAISLITMQAFASFDLFNRYLNALERDGKLDRALDFIPDEKLLTERKIAGKGLSAPDIAVLLCQSKIYLKDAILASDLPEENDLNHFLMAAFPKPLHSRFGEYLLSHPLRREIIATKLSNLVVNEVGFSFVYRLQDETGAPVSAIVRAYIIARSVLNMDAIRGAIEGLHACIDAKAQTELMMACIRLLRRITRWFLRQKRTRVDISETIERYAPGIEALKRHIPQVFGEAYRKEYNEYFEKYQSLCVLDTLAHELACIRVLLSGPDIIELAHEQSLDVGHVAEIYFGIGEFLHLTWIRAQVVLHPSENHWEALSREALRDDLDWQHRQLTLGIIRQLCQNQHDIRDCFEAWATQHSQLIVRWKQVLANLRASAQLNYTMFFVAIRELSDLTQTTLQVSGALVDEA